MAVLALVALSIQGCGCNADNITKCVEDQAKLPADKMCENYNSYVGCIKDANCCSNDDAKTALKANADALESLGCKDQQRRNYRGVGHAMAMIARSEGILGLFKGASTTSIRAMASTFGTLAFNAQAKEMLQEMGAPRPVCVAGGSLIAGFAAAFFSLPFDFVKTQVQKMRADPVTGKMPYSGPLDCAAQQLRAGGVLRFWAGFPTYYAKFAPQIGIALVMQDQIKSMWKALGV